MTATTDTRELLTLDRVDLNELFRQAVEIQNECRDFNVSNVTYKNVRYDGDTCRLLYQPDDTSVGSRSMAMTRHSLSQLCNKIGVPIRYIDKCIDSGRLDLAADNINSWIDDFGKNCLSVSTETLFEVFSVTVILLLILLTLWKLSTMCLILTSTVLRGIS